MTTRSGAAAALLALFASAPAFADTVTQNTDPTTVLPGYGIACTSGSVSAGNGYMRVFDLSGVGTTDVTVSGVQFGVEESFAGPQSVFVSIHTLSGALVLANLTTLATEEVVLGDGSLYLVDVPFAPGVIVPTDEPMVIEIYSPDSVSVAGDDVFFPGANNAGQSGPTYIVAPGCGIAEPTDFAAIGFPDSHVLMTVTYTPNGAPPDADGDGIPDATDVCPNDPSNDEDGDTVCGGVDQCEGDDFSGDSDSDLLCDNLDFTLDVSPILPGGPAFFAVHNAVPGTRVVILASVQGDSGGPCAPGGFMCTALVAPKAIAKGYADANGEFSATGVIPAYISNFPTTWYQAFSFGPADWVGVGSEVETRVTGP